MLNVKTILLPVDFPNTSLGVIHQAATLARHFHSELVLLHVASARSYAAGVPQSLSNMGDWDLLAAITQEAEKKQDDSLKSQLEGLAIRCVLLTGDPDRAIVRTSQAEKANLIMMPSYGFTFDQFLQGSLQESIVNGSECPVWTGAHVEVSPAPEFAVRNVLCAVDFGARSRAAASFAAQIAAEFSAGLTLIHVTPLLEVWGPGGSYVNPKRKKELVDAASEHLANLQREMGIKAETFVGSGDRPKVLGQAAGQTKADLLVIACYPYGGNLRINGYGVITAVPIPVVSV
jgi:nucleotide-binding universal stress UspA family protein